MKKIENFNLKSRCFGIFQIFLFVFFFYFTTVIITAQENWTSTIINNTIVGRDSHTAVWTGSKMIIWGGQRSPSTLLKSGGIYDPVQNSWTNIDSINAPSARWWHTAVWTGSKMIIWGGLNSSELNTGGLYDPNTDHWDSTTLINAPYTRDGHTAVWTGSKMIIWGGEGYVTGQGSLFFKSGGIYDPTTNSWTPMDTTTAPTGRWWHTAVWTGSKMIIWGGRGNNQVYFNTGGIYDPATNSWTATSTTNAPSGRQLHVAVWTGSKMIVWGGETTSVLYTGGVYDPNTNSWTSTNNNGTPDGCIYNSCIWSGSRMVIWGGADLSNAYNTGAMYDPVSDSWTPTTTNNAPSARALHTGVWTGNSMIIWGGSFLNTGGIYTNPILVGINNEKNILPKEFQLYQNYPNPFNPSTTINYELPVSSFVKLIVYDVMGREIKILVNENQNAGYYNVEFDGTNLSSGIYFFKLQAGNYLQVKKMSLIK